MYVTRIYIVSDFYKYGICVWKLELWQRSGSCGWLYCKQLLTPLTMVWVSIPNLELSSHNIRFTI